jgi:CRP-like cAMP-binding protein
MSTLLNGSRDVQATLSSLPLFRSVSPRVLTLIQPEQMTKVYSDGDVIFREGTAPDSLVVILQGTVGVLAGERLIASRGATEIVGEGALIENTPRWASTVAQGTVEALVLPRGVVEQLLADPIVLRNLLGILARKLREATTPPTS